tara:strand:+ start:2811 stop:3650 length:840 start_codon:yes stop_codon:yes gene_type:complete
MEENLKSIYWEGNWRKEGDVSFGLNRAFRFGDGLFESILAIHDKLPLIDLHLNRLKEGMKVLLLNDENSFLNGVQHLIENKLAELGYRNSIVRIWVFRDGGGKYTPTTNTAAFCVQIEERNNSSAYLNKKGLTIDICKTVNLSYSTTSKYKTISSLPYILASIEKEQSPYDDLILLNQNNLVAEATSSNLFLIKNNQIFTPPLSSGCVEGVGRTHFINMESIGLAVEEKEISLKDIIDADELFLLNAVTGPKWVAAFQQKRYFHQKIDKISSMWYLSLS